MIKEGQESFLGRKGSIWRRTNELKTDLATDVSSEVWKERDRKGNDVGRRKKRVMSCLI